MVARSKTTCELSTGLILDGAVITLSDFWHPEKGQVTCPAAPLLQARLDSLGIPSKPGAADRGDIGGTISKGSGTLVATTFTMPGGEVLGLAVAAPPRWVGQARRAVADWSAAVRTRRLFVPAVVPECWEVAESASARIPHPARSGQHWCPKRRLIESAAKNFTSDGDTVLLVGLPGSSTQRGTGHSGFPCRLVRVPDVETAQRMALPPNGKAAFVLAPCTSVRAASGILAVLRARLPRLRGMHPDQWCYRADDNRAAVAGAVAASDLVLSLGAGTARQAQLGPEVIPLESWKDLEAEQVSGVSTITAVNAAPPSAGVLSLAEVREVLAGLGPLAVTDYRVATESRLHPTSESSKRRTV